MTALNVTALKQFAAILKGIFDEIADQSAYRRHLAWHGTRHSGAEWRKFCDARWEAASRRGKCC
jgi:hypothetical protein